MHGKCFIFFLLFFFILFVVPFHMTIKMKTLSLFIETSKIYIHMYTETYIYRWILFKWNLFLHRRAHSWYIQCMSVCVTWTRNFLVIMISGMRVSVIWNFILFSYQTDRHINFSNKSTRIFPIHYNFNKKTNGKIKDNFHLNAIFTFIIRYNYS